MKIPFSLFLCSFCQIKTLFYFQHRTIISAKAHARAWSFVSNPHIPTHIFLNFVLIHWFFCQHVWFCSHPVCALEFLFLSSVGFNASLGMRPVHAVILSTALLPKYDLFFIYRMIFIIFVDHFYFDLSRNKSMHEDDHRGIVTRSGVSAERSTHVSSCSLHINRLCTPTRQGMINGWLTTLTT